MLGRTVRGVSNGPSPRWLAERLTAIGLRPINALVDVTNFFTIDLGRPLHVFDAKRLDGHVLTLRRGAGETFRALTGSDVTVTDEDCVIADAAGVQSLGGIIGGEATGCDETTTEVFVECALFDPVRIALGGRRHQIASRRAPAFRARRRSGPDAARYRGGDANDPVALRRRGQPRRCGRRPSAVEPPCASPLRASRRPRRRRGAAGRGGERAREARLCGREPRRGARDRCGASWRNDIAAPIALEQAPGLDPARAAAVAAGCAEIEPECDLIEEVLRVRGLDNIPSVSLPRAAPVPDATLTSAQTRRAVARRTLAAQGLAECVTFSFMPAREAALFGDAPSALRLVNPIAADLDQLRPTPVATLALAAQRNAARGYADLALFEVGPAFADDTAAGQRVIAAGLRTGATPRSWIEPARGVDAIDVKGDVWAALAAIGVPMEALTVSADAPAFYHPGRSGVVRQGPKIVLATFGELHPRVLAALDLAGPAVAFELFLDAVADPKRRRKAPPDLPPFQPVRRDFAFVVDATVTAEAVVRAARGADRALITAVTLFDRYTGDKLPVGKVSLGIEVAFQPRERTLTDAEIEAASAKVVAAVAKATGGVLR